MTSAEENADQSRLGCTFGTSTQQIVGNATAMWCKFSALSKRMIKVTSVLVCFSISAVLRFWISEPGALFIAYLVATLFFFCWVLRDLLIQLRLPLGKNGAKHDRLSRGQKLYDVSHHPRTSMEKPWYMFVPDYFIDDAWNTVDVACLVTNGFVINSIFRWGVWKLQNVLVPSWASV